MSARSHRPNRDLAPPVAQAPSVATPQPELDPGLLGNQEMLGRLDLRQVPPRDPRLGLPFLDGVPGADLVRDAVNGYLRDPMGKDAPQPNVPPPVTDPFDPCALSVDPARCAAETTPTMVTTPKIAF